MASLRDLIDAYLDVNILLAYACVLWIMARFALRLAGLGHAYTAQLRAIRAVFLAIVFSPFALWAVTQATDGADVALFDRINLADFVVSQYLQGNFQMSPERLETILGARRTLAAGEFGALVTVVLALFAAGFAFFFFRLAASMLKLRRVLDDSFVWRRIGRVELRLSDTTTVPFSTRGLRRRIIVLPSTMLAEPEDMRIALGHELQHLRQRDVDWEIAMEVLKPFFFWNPAFHIWRRMGEELRELSCDRQVIERRGYDVAAYCQCLLRVCHNSLKRRRLFALQAPVVALVQTESRLFGHRSVQVLRHRMVSLIDGKAERHPGMVAALLLGPLVALTFLAAVAIQRPGDWSQDRLMLSTIINLERLAVMNANSTLTQPSY
ncbi:hypothetical protein OU426_03275 [Frigidibacter sp. RF13]|uniref:M56 family metallopeptidase n=1 Tax=Frigidibacter sp. RF13 TaxID=2997340 RepID=UPI0022703A8D|nr:M56 family metallopeptidase [Frigidibacter sp. RF13]MCY1125865.1 hypothetical protein [Frigidibacter sp. RF13]